jgi:DNA-binding LacI/PurR family transcriptional regulator
MASLTSVDFSTISQKKYEMGIIGTEILIKKIEKKTPAMANKIVLEPKLMIHKTCGFHLKGYVR